MRRSRRERRRERATLRALTSSALALLGAAGKASADTAIDHIETSYTYSTYSEDKLEASKTIPNADRERYSVSTQQLGLAAPITDWLDMSLDVTHETMSGASPWYNGADAAHQPIQILSGATISDTRNDLSLHGNYYTEDGRLGFGGGYSTENDYDAINFGTDGELHFNEKNTTLSGGLGTSFDTLTPTDSDKYKLRPKEASKQSYSTFVGLGQIINRRSMIQGSITYNWSKGFLSDPYKEVFGLGGSGQRFYRDDRGGSRHQFAFLLRYNRHIEETESTLHLTYQYYIDTWGVSSHQAELDLYQNFGDALQIAPHIRYYSQNAADFYVAYLGTTQKPMHEMSSDYRLSAYGALSFGVKAEYAFHTPWLRDIEWRANLGIERYMSSGDLALQGVAVPAPGLVSFTVMSAGLQVVF